MGIGSVGVHFVLLGDVRRYLRISGILMESRHSVADGKSARQVAGNHIRHRCSRAMRGMPRKQQALLAAMVEIIAKDLVPFRPGLEEPRAKKNAAPRTIIFSRNHATR